LSVRLIAPTSKAPQSIEASLGGKSLAESLAQTAPPRKYGRSEIFLKHAVAHLRRFRQACMRDKILHQIKSDERRDETISWVDEIILKQEVGYPIIGGGLNRSPQHFILEGKDGVWDGTEIS
jgi:hypothetical protein